MCLFVTNVGQCQCPRNVMFISVVTIQYILNDAMDCRYVQVLNLELDQLTISIVATIVFELLQALHKVRRIRLVVGITTGSVYSHHCHPAAL
eukprot:scaffold8152_cov195-Amphora_coffeaeformis.AAC.1